jgi:hypothetical protein
MNKMFPVAITSASSAIGAKGIGRDFRESMAGAQRSIGDLKRTVDARARKMKLVQQFMRL